MSLTSGDVREFLRDYGDFNVLLDAVEFTEDEIEKAMQFATDRYNLITPTSNVTPDTFPNRWLLLIGTCIHLLQSAAFLQLRNQATYNDGDVERIGIDDKFALYQQLANSLASDWSQSAQKLKQQKNMEGAYDSLGSGYGWLRSGSRNVS